MLMLGELIIVLNCLFKSCFFFVFCFDKFFLNIWKQLGYGIENLYIFKVKRNLLVEIGKLKLGDLNFFFSYVSSMIQKKFNVDFILSKKIYF